MSDPTSLYDRVVRLPDPSGRIALCGGIGLLASVIVAWGCAIRAADGSYDTGSCFGVASIFAATWLGGDGMLSPQHQRWVLAPAVEAINTANSIPHPPLLPWSNNRANCFGWPLFSLWYQFTSTSAPGATHVLADNEYAIGFGWPGRAKRIAQPIEALPVRPLWLGLLGNRLFYGLMF